MMEDKPRSRSWGDHTSARTACRKLPVRPCTRVTSFDSYKIPRFSWLPKIETILVENTDVPPQGGGEPPITCVGAVIANAVFDATGVRLFQMPMTPVRVKEALTKGKSEK